jgi:hypothetical protein
MKAAAAQFETSTAACPDADELIAHHRHTSEPHRREQIESHLVQCPACREKLRDVSDFFEEPRAREGVMPATEVNREWDLLRARIEAPRRPAEPRMTSGRPPASRWMLALAACLVAALALSATWSLRMARQQSAAQQKLRETEEANRRLQQDREADRQQIAQLQLPRANTPIHDVFSSHSLARSGGTVAAKRIDVSPGAPFTLLLSGEGVRDSPDYEIEILDSQNRSLWKVTGLRRGALGNFVLTLNGDFLSAGEYRFRLAGKTAKGYEPVAEYAIALRRLP